MSPEAKRGGLCGTCKRRGGRCTCGETHCRSCGAELVPNGSFQKHAGKPCVRWTLPVYFKLAEHRHVTRFTT